MKHLFLFYFLSCISIFAAEEKNQTSDETSFKYAKEFDLSDGKKINVCITNHGQTRIYDQNQNWYAIGHVPIIDTISCVFVDKKDYRVLILSDRASYNFGFVTASAMAGKLSSKTESFTLAQNRDGNLFAVLLKHILFIFDEDGVIDGKVAENVFNVASLEFSATNEQLFVTHKIGDECSVSQYGIVANREVLENIWKYNPVVLKVSNQNATLFAALHRNNNLVLYDNKGHLIDENLGHNIDINTACYLEFSTDDRFVTVIYEDFLDDKPIFYSSRHEIITDPKILKNLGKGLLLKTMNRSKTLIAAINSQGYLIIFDAQGQSLDMGEKIVKPRSIEFDEEKKRIVVASETGQLIFDIAYCVL